MRTTIKVKKKVNLIHLFVQANVRYWEDATVNGVDDENGDLIPCRSGDCWCPTIEIDTGKIIEWPQGTRADIHYKICDEGNYRVIDDQGDIVFEIDGYVPDTMCPEGQGYGDYIIMKVDETGTIKNWKFNPKDFK